MTRKQRKIIGDRLNPKHITPQVPAMNDKLVECLKRIEIHADALMKVPASEQWIGSMQSVISIAILEIKRAIELVMEAKQRGVSESPSTVDSSGKGAA